MTEERATSSTAGWTREDWLRGYAAGDPAPAPAHRNPFRHILGFLAVNGMILYLLIAYLFRRIDRIRYQLTIVVETPDGLRRGSSVIEAMIEHTTPFWGDDGIHHRIRGEAPSLVLPDGRWALLLLHDNYMISFPYRAAMATGIVPRPTSGRRPTNGDIWRKLKAIRPDIRIDAATLNGRMNSTSLLYPPDIVVIDPGDVGTIRAIDIAQPAATLGEGTRIVGLELKVVATAPVITLDQRAPWLSGITQELDRTASTTRKLQQSLRLERFVAKR